MDIDETPDSVLKTAHDAITGQRRHDYGSPLESFQRIADIATAGLSHKLTEPGDTITRLELTEVGDKRDADA